MPNWCHNKLSVFGLPEQLEQFRKDAYESQEQPLSFQKLVPMPAQLLKAKSGGPLPDWYEWRLENWGTKWDANFSGPGIAIGSEAADPDDRPEPITERALELNYNFDTAWSPPLEFLVNCSRNYPGLTFVLHYAEPGMDYAGKYTVIEGVVADEAVLAVEDVLTESEMWY